MTHHFKDVLFLQVHIDINRETNHYPKIEATIDWRKFRKDVEELMQSLGRQQGTGYRLNPHLIDAR